MSSSSSSSIILSLLLLYAAAVLISCATIGKNSNDAGDDEAMEKQFNNLLRLIIDCVKMLMDGKDSAHVQKILMLELESTKDTRIQLNDYLYRRMDTNKDGFLSKEEHEDFTVNVLLPKIVTLANIPKAMVEKIEKIMPQAKPAMQMFLGQVFDEADTNGDGKLSLAEIMSYKMDKVKLKQNMQKMLSKAKAEEARNKPIEEF